jgi:hypothetical protein
MQDDDNDVDSELNAKGCGWFIALTVSATLALATLNYFKPPRPVFSPLQPVEAVQADYAACKAKAPKGFDCAMVPMMVSEEFMKRGMHE